MIGLNVPNGIRGRSRVPGLCDPAIPLIIEDRFTGADFSHLWDVDILDKGSFEYTTGDDGLVVTNCIAGLSAANSNHQKLLRPLGSKMVLNTCFEFMSPSAGYMYYFEFGLFDESNNLVAGMRINDSWANEIRRNIATVLDNVITVWVNYGLEYKFYDFNLVRNGSDYNWYFNGLLIRTATAVGTPVYTGFRFSRYATYAFPTFTVSRFSIALHPYVTGEKFGGW